MESTRCARCSKVCSGETLRYNDQLFHTNCLSCVVCGKNLTIVGFFTQDGHYFCPEDFQERFGTKCYVCQQFLEGEGITIGGNSYHEGCFVCAECRDPFPPGDKVVFNGKTYVCQKCENISSVNMRGHTLEKCAGCGDDIRTGQALLALEKQWHLWCFTCTRCGCLLAGEYMGRDEKPYCEKDYQAEFGVTCAGCGGYITGKVLQAGEKHYHPQCSRCARCHGVFGEGQEMYLQGSEIWHPDCSKAAAQNGDMDQTQSGERPGSKEGQAHIGKRTVESIEPFNLQDDEGRRPPPPARTSASRTTDWKVRYHPQGDREGTYRTDGGTGIYPYSELVTTNYRLPRGVDKTKLETYLTDEEFMKVFFMTKDQFYRLPQWKQQSRKKEALLF